VIPAGFALFGLFGGFATARSSLTSGPLSWLVALAAAVAGAATVMVLFSYARRASTSSANNVIVPGSPLSQAADRRRILAYGGAAVGAIANVIGSGEGADPSVVVAEEVDE